MISEVTGDEAQPQMIICLIEAVMGGKREIVLEMSIYEFFNV